MKFTASILTIFAASILVLQGCSSDTTSDRNELAGVLDAAADREGVPPSECRNTCVKKALAVFDECAVGIDGREECFGRAIHTFFECVRECPAPEPPTCKDRCESHAREVYDRCIENGAGGTDGGGGIVVEPKTGAGGEDGDGGEDKRCAAIAREALETCIEENCGDPEPPTCEGECKLAAAAVLEECLDGAEGDVEEAACIKLAREAYAECVAGNCEEPEPPTCDEECEAVATQLRDDCVEAGGDLDECNMEARAALAICLEKHCEAPPTCEDRCGDLATRVFDACTDKIDSEER
jgi:hypothetical protein